MDLAEKRRLFEAEALPHLQNLYYFALKLYRNQEEAENLVQETYLRAFKGFKTYSIGTNVKAWLFKIMNNTFISLKRKENRDPRPEEADVIERKLASRDEMRAQLDAEMVVMQDVMDGSLEMAFSELAEENQQILLLVDVEEMDYQAVSDVLEVPVGTVKSRVSRARAKLRELYLIKRRQEERREIHG